jgi:putative transposase
LGNAQRINDSDHVSVVGIHDAIVNQNYGIKLLVTGILWSLVICITAGRDAINRVSTNRGTSMTLYKNKYRIESARKPGWDYESNGAYFITICTHDRQHFFGNIQDGMMDLSIAGEFAQKFWWEIPARFSDIQLDAFIVMPNHIHGILIIDRHCQPTGRDAINRVSTTNYGTNKSIHSGGVTANHNPMLSDQSISKIIRWYKGRCKFEISKTLPEFAWQPRFHDRIIRDRTSFNHIRHYIQTNPKRWKIDKFYT